jgi:mono/diheme cytochrome c family protein
MKLLHVGPVSATEKWKQPAALVLMVSPPQSTMRNSHHILAGFLAILPAPLWAATAELTKEQTDFFEGKIRPILSETCYKCHSVEKGKSKGNLTLDMKAGWEKGGEGGPAIVPGNPEKSLLYTALTYADKDLQMPPSSSGGKLSAQQIADIAQWIKMGAPDPRTGTEVKKTKLSGLTDAARKHWAYQIPARYAFPNNKNQQWCRTSIDNFILQKLEEKGMLPSPDASRETLLRRVTYDLIGLPPTYAETEAFMNDTEPNAFEKVVDRLLASPAYGERWGRHWLDTARYADTVGGPRNANRNAEYRYADAWTYRDYVVKAFNDDKPYTDFIIEQLAADRIPDISPNDPRLAALGFLTVGERFRNANDIINDRIDVVSKGFLAMTVVCARCHDHMFDPIPTKDYYALHGVFANITEPADKPLIGMKATPAQRQDFDKKYTAIVKGITNQYYDLVGPQLTEFYRAPGAYIRAAVTNGGRKGKGNDEQKEMVSQYKLDADLVQLIGRGMQQNPSVWGPLASFRNGGGMRFKPMTAMSASAIAEKLGDKGGKLAMMMGRRASEGTNPLVEKALIAAQPKTFDGAVEVYAQLFESLTAKSKGFIPAMRNAVSAQVPEYEEAVIDLLRGPFEVLPAPLITEDWLQAATQGFPRKLAGRGRMNFGAINLLEITHPGAPARAMVVKDKDTPVNSPVLIRGQPQTRGDVVPRGFLEILSPGQKSVQFSKGSGRYELAMCIASKENPLTARVIVNRVWMHHFGEGFVRTPDDLGTMSEKPTHPELFDFLANWLMDTGWSLKKLHKFIVMSRVFQESSHTREEYETLDPGNRLLWRANVRRLDFEATRDSLLVYSGDLDRTVGGKPINLTEEPYSYRRSVYGYIDRGNLPELMAHFDFSDPDMPNSKRSTTIVPQQALFLMNSPMAVDVTRKILSRSEITRQSTELSRISAIYRLIFQRYPTLTEINMANKFLATETKLQAEVAAQIATKTAMAGNGKSGNGMRRGDGKFGAIQNEGSMVTRKVLTPWETFVQVLLFSNEAAYVN